MSVVGHWTAERPIGVFPTLSKTGRMHLMSRMTGRLQRYPARRMILVTPGFVPERDRTPAPFKALAEAAELRDRFPEADIPEEVRGGFLIPPEFTPELMNLSPTLLNDESGPNGDFIVPTEFTEGFIIRGLPTVIAAIGFPIEPLPLSPREESLLREAPIFRTSQLEEEYPQPDVIVNPKEPQC